jgi:hypothetical protein
MPQAFGQPAGWLGQQVDAERLAVTDVPFIGDVPAVATATHWLQHAGGLAEALQLALANAQVATEVRPTPATMSRTREHKGRYLT